ncbi:PIG-P-domain-containing protein [Amniculicola lignicola CBS 123094]|uniref:PIG-P-domain-containing protein n=1 Tax=Amniculicola lignicola CBS 123094 TaxID=1392246 RepID=A0A6A5W4S6_9PLEO|nr:PIG-P-domain-containing protein [Amniculicola lignicola CBS 123094]
MPPQSRGNQVPSGFQSKSTPNLPTLRSLQTEREAPLPAHNFTNPRSPAQDISPSDLASGEDNVQEEEHDHDPFALAPPSGSESDDSDEDFNPPTARPLFTSRSHTHLTASTLFPPFYNRPPTPLPPSPSLTSLLRPSFSTQTSRPTTPDSSDIEVPSSVATATNGASTPASTANLASITKSARHAPTVPRASPKVPTYEYYGFALYLASSAAFLMYILWAYVPSPLLHQMGIHYYPNRWWALAVPSWMVATVMYIYVALASYNTRYLTLPLSSCENLVDECAQIAMVDRRTGKIVRDRVVGSSSTAEQDKSTGSRSNSFSAFQYGADEDVDWKKLWSTGTDAVMDVPIGGVCEVLYGAGREATI